MLPLESVYHNTAYEAYPLRGADEEEGKPKAKARKAKKTGDEEGEADNEEDDEGEKDEEEPDWKGMFDDDEEEGVVLLLLSHTVTVY